MIEVTLPDGSKREYEDGASPLDVAQSISKSLAKKALAAKVDGELRDLGRPLEGDADVAIVTASDAEGLELIRHDAAHVLAQAVQALFPGTQVTIGPVIEDGFYYDFAREEPFSTDDFEKIEAKMREIVDADYPIQREVWEKEEAIATFKSIGEDYKAQIIDDIIPPGEPITVYRQGEWFDLCRGPHLPSTGKLPKAFKLMKLAGAYWRGDHRRLGQEMDLFHLQPEAQGSVFWHPKGFRLWRELEAYIRRRLDADGYDEVKTPQLLDKSLWERSGHWAKFRDGMFLVPDAIPSLESEALQFDAEADVLALKPMNCPAHIQIFKSAQRSYRDLPIRMAEFGCCHRNESHGSLHGLLRVRQMTQDDAHIFCREDQVVEETKTFLDLFARVYDDFGMTDIAYKLATRPELRAGDDASWDKAEENLANALRAAGLDFEIAEGEGAFYGPKLEFHLTDAIGRTWQAGTFQLDYVLPERLDAFYIGEDGEKHRPVMLHRAVFGTFERFAGLLIEHHAGAFPLWLAPVQVVVATIVSDADAYAEEAADALRAAGLRVETDLRNEKINYKVREHSVQKVPVIAVVGRREAEEGKLALRRLGSKDQDVVTLEEAAARLAEEATPPDLRKAKT